MRSIRYLLSEFRAQQASCLRPKVAQNSLASATSFGTQFTVYRIDWRAQRASLLRPKRVPNEFFVYNSTAETLFFSVRCIIPLFHPPIGVYTRYFLTIGAIMDFFSVRCIIPPFHPPIGVYTRYFLTLGARDIIARLEILSTWIITPLQFYTILICTNTAPHAPYR